MEQLHNIFNRKALLWIAAALVPVLLALICFFIPNTIAHATNERIISIYHDGQEQIVASDAKTVGEVLERANITLGQYDTVEPSKDTELVATDYSINVYRARPVTVVDGNQRYRVMTAHTSAKKIAEAAGIPFYDEDSFTLERIDDFVSEQGAGLILTIKRSTPVNLVLYGKAAEVRTRATTIADFIKEKNIQLGVNDGVSPSADTPIIANMNIAVYSNGMQTISEEQEVAFETERINDSDHEAGYKEIKEAGVKGKKLVTYQIELRDGQEISRKEIQSVVTVEAKKQVEIVGTKATFSGSFGDALAQLRACEAGGNYANKNNPLYRGAYQYSYSTWANYGGYYDPADAPAAVQDQAAYETYLRRGWQPWPQCGASLPDTFR